MEGKPRVAFSLIADCSRECLLLADFVVEVGDFDHQVPCWYGTGHCRSCGSIIVGLAASAPLPEGPLDCRWRSNNQLCKPAKVLRNSSERKLVLRTAWAAQPQSPKSQNALKVSK